MQWFRLYNEFATDPKVQMMSEAMQRRLIMLMCLQSCNVTVTLPVTERDASICFSLRISEQEMIATKALFIERGFIDSDWNLLNWEKRQQASDSSAERVARHREKKKQKCNDDVTLQKQECNVLDKNRIDKNRIEKEISNDISKKPTFDYEHGSFENLPEIQVESWKTAYPAIDVDREIKRAAAWLLANKKNRKSNVTRFLNNWLSRAQDSAPRVQAVPPSPTVKLFPGVGQ